MRILYHPKRILGFEPYVAPTGFDRKAQPVDIYDVFEKYYRHHRDAKYIYSVMDTITNPHYGNEQHQLYPGYAYWNPAGFSFHYGYEKDGEKYTFDIIPTTRVSVTDTVLTVASTAGFPDTGKLCFDGWLYSVGGFNYTSKDETHFYGTRIGSFGGWSNAVSYVIDFTGTTNRWVIVNNSLNSFANQDAIVLARGADWLYSAKCRGVYICEASYAAFGYGGGSDMKYVHCNSLSDITTLSGGWTSESASMRGASLTGVLHIPTSVTRIPAYFYSQNATLTGTLTIPSNITSIDIGAFYYDMFDTIVSNAANFNVTDYVLYDITGGTKVEANYVARGRSGSLTFRSDTTKILDYCCYYCSLKTGTLTIPSTCLSIGSAAFYYCSGLTGSLTIPNTVTSVGGYAYYYCSGFTGNLIIPNSLTVLNGQTFQYCSGLNGTLTFESTSQIVTIGDYVFSNTKLSGDLTLPASLRTLSYVAFYYCSYFKGSLTFEEGIETFTTQSFANGCVFTGTLTLPSTLTSIINPSAFTSTHNFDSIVITGSSVSYLVVDNILYDIKSSLKVAVACARNYANTLTLESDTTEIGVNAFYSCIKRTGTLIIPNSVTIINNGALYSCTGITSITFGSGLVTIGTDAFRQMTGISENLVIPNSVETIGATAFYNNTARTGTLTLGTGLKTIGGAAFGNVPFTGTLTIPSLVTAIGEGAFYNNNFTAIASSATGFTVYDYVLYDETASGQIKAHTSARGYAGTLTFKAGTTSILLYCLYNNDNRTGAIVIPYTVTAIGQQAFDDCAGFNSTATIGDATNGSGLTTVGYLAFRSCPNITGWNIYRTPAPTCNSSFSSYAKPLHVKSGATGYDVTPATNAAPWTNTAIFSSITYDL